jgi:hypothetical protein
MARYCPDKDGPVLYLDCMECKEKTCKAFFLLVAGSRTFSDYHLLEQKLDYFLQNKKDVIIVSGGAHGADNMAEDYAKDRGFRCMVFRAEWEKYGKRAGYIRNRNMHKFISKQDDRGVVIFWDGKSKGTAHSLELSKEFRNELKLVYF